MQTHYFMLVCIGRPIIYLHVYLAIYIPIPSILFPRTYHSKLLSVDVVVQTVKKETYGVPHIKILFLMNISPVYTTPNFLVEFGLNLSSGAYSCVFICRVLQLHAQ